MYLDIRAIVFSDDKFRVNSVKVTSLQAPLLCWNTTKAAMERVEITLNKSTCLAVSVGSIISTSDILHVVNARVN